MTSATDELLVSGYPYSLRPELHKALKARGIDYWLAQGITFWNRDDGCECLAYGYKVNGVPKLAIKVVGFTDPEQAIAATLGVEPDEAAMVKLHDRMNAALLEYERAQGIEKRDGDGRVVVPFVAEMHSLLEEAAALGSSNCTNDCTNSERMGTCHDKGTFKSWGFFTCSNCSIVIPLDAVKDAPSIGRVIPPKYCPNCGARVVEPTTNDVDAEVTK